LASKASSLIPRGVLLMQILVEGKTPQDVATKDNLDAWIAKVPLPYTTALDSVDPQDPMETFFVVPRDQFILVDLKTMKFLDILDADPNSAIAEIEGMLPPVDGGAPDM
jgi:hypothetical protein